jgi:hypothetical protein
MRFWTREIAGWVLVAMGLYIFYTCFQMLVKKEPWQEPPRIVEAAVLTPIAFIIFRGGIHLLKVAVAARVCMQTQERLGEQRPSPSGGRRTQIAAPASRPVTASRQLTGQDSP